MNPIDRNREAAINARTEIARIVKASLKKKGEQAAKQITSVSSKFEKASNEPSQSEIDAILASMNLDWRDIPDDLIPVLTKLISDSVSESFSQIGLIDRKALEQANETAIAFARDRGAEMVGMKWVNDELVDNPNAEWSIAESTRDMLRSTVKQALEEGWSNDKLSSSIQDNAAFSSGRSEMIARTETAIADVQGNMITYKEAEASGIDIRKKWITANDDLVSDDCAANGEEAPIDLDDLFASGADAPPDHPRCRCDVAPAVAD